MSTRLLLWLLLGLAQLAVPSWLILREERTLSEGHEYLFRLAPVDPTDPFRGRFMNLAFDVEATPVGLTAEQPAERSTPLYASLGRDGDGFACIQSVGTIPPAGDHLLIPMDKWTYSWKEKNKVRVQLPFQRFYLNETRAASVEQKARTLLEDARAAKTKSNVHALVKVLDGRATLIELRAPDGKKLQ